MKIALEIRKSAFLAFLLAADALAFVAAMSAGEGVRRLARAVFRPSLSDSLPPFGWIGPETAAGAVIIVIVFAYEKLYVRRFAFWEETRRIIRAFTLAVLLLGVMEAFPGARPSYPAPTLILAWMAGLALFPLIRRMVKTAFHGFGLWPKNVLIIGTNATAREAARMLESEKMRGCRVVGFLAEEKSPHPDDDIRILGGIDDLNESAMAAWDVQDIFIVLPEAPPDRVVAIARKCESLAESIKIVPPFGELYRLGLDIDTTGSILFVAVARNLFKPWNILAKRIFDVFFAVLLLVLLSPVLLVLAAAVKLDSRGPVLHSHLRLGKKNRTFRIWKFRSMHLDADKRLAEFLQSHPQARREMEEFRKIKTDDPRPTRAGRWLRKRSLDELPQLINVLKGDMSLVGPRPYLPEEKDKLGEMSSILRAVPPGISGLWQVGGRNARTFDERVRMDDDYVRNWSLWLDVIILIKTISVWIKGDGAY
jgi:Undecaprenyl-phosphate galactose phosphotransferase WbaP